MESGNAEAVAMIGKLFGLDCDALYREFHRRWKDIKSSLLTERVKEKVESHFLVGRLVPVSPLR